MEVGRPDCVQDVHGDMGEMEYVNSPGTPQVCWSRGDNERPGTRQAAVAQKRQNLKKSLLSALPVPQVVRSVRATCWTPWPLCSSAASTLTNKQRNVGRRVVEIHDGGGKVSQVPRQEARAR